MKTTCRTRATLLAATATVAFLAGCLSAQYTPAPSLPQAWTPCADQREAAYRAREDLMERETLYRRERAAQDVYTHAACEAEALGRIDVVHADTDDAADSLRRARSQYATAMTLYYEAASYGATPWTTAADAGIGRLDHHFAAMLRSVPDADAMEEIALGLDKRALTAHRRVVDTIGASKSFIARYPEAAHWHREACLALESAAGVRIQGCTPFADTRAVSLR